MHKLRTVRLEQRAQAALDALFAQYPPLEEVYEGIEKRICHSPESGAMKVHEKDGTDYFIIRVDGWVKVPSLVLLYRYDAEMVYVLSAHTVPTSTAD